MKTYIPTKTQLKTWTTEHLWGQLRNAIRLTTDGLHLVAVLWTELRSRGEDMSKIDLPWAEHLSAIADGKLDPKILVVFGGKPAGVISTMVKLSRDDQARLVKPGYKVPVLTHDEKDVHKTISRSPASLNATEVAQVLGDGTIRTPEEQRDYLPARRRTPSPPPATTNPDNALLDALPLTPEQRKQLINYAATRRPPTLVTELVMRWLVQHKAMKATPSHSRARRERDGEAWVTAYT